LEGTLQNWKAAGIMAEPGQDASPDFVGTADLEGTLKNWKALEMSVLGLSMSDCEETGPMAQAAVEEAAECSQGGGSAVVEDSVESDWPGGGTTWEQDRSAWQSRREVEPFEKITIDVDPRSIGRIAGPNGRNLLAIKRKTGCHSVQASPAGITVFGPIYAARLAAKLLSDAVLFEDDDLRSATIKVNTCRVPDLIGKKGQIVKQIQGFFGVKVQIPPVHEQKQVPRVEVSIFGPRDAVSRAMETINDIVEFAHAELTHPGEVHSAVDMSPSQFHEIIRPNLRYIHETFNVRVVTTESKDVKLIVGQKKDALEATAYVKALLESDEGQQEWSGDEEASAC